MEKVVRVKVGKESDAPIRTMKESVALRMQTTHPDIYTILEPPKIEVTKIPPIEPEKKSAAVAAGELNAGNAIPTNVPKLILLPPQTTQEVITRKPGRPKAS